MKAFSTITSRAVPLPRKDVDTDLIIPAQYLTSISAEGFGKNLFRRLRDADPVFPLNDIKYAGAQILAADHNFGCGSSREHAVWALQEHGFQVVIAKSFADIFSSNAANNGLLLVTLPEETVDHILREAAAGDLELTVDLAAQEVKLGDGTKRSFPFDPFRKYCLLNGLDTLDYILSYREDIEAYTKKRSAEPLPDTTRGA